MSDKHRIVLVGVSARGIAESAVRAGYNVIALDYFGDSDLRRLCATDALRDHGQSYAPERLVALAAQHNADAVAYVASFENHPAAVAALSVGRELLGNAPEVLRQVRDPLALAVCLANIGAPVPQIRQETGDRRQETGDRRQETGDRRQETGDEDRQLKTQNSKLTTSVRDQQFKTHNSQLTTPAGEVRWLRKPLKSGGGHAITRWEPGQEIDERYVVQEEIVGSVCSVAFVADGARAVVLGLSRQLVGRSAFGAAAFRHCGNIVPLPLGARDGAAVLAQVRRIAGALTATFGLRGVNGLDFVLRGGQVYTIEVNPRFSASMELIERAYGLSAFDLHVRGCRGELPAFDLAAARADGYHAKAILFAQRDITMGDTSGWCARDIRDVPHPGEEIGEGHPICTVFARGETWQTCYRRLLAARDVYDDNT